MSFVRVAIVFLSVAIAGLGCGVEISEDVARRIAEDRFTSYCKDFSIDVNLLEGPRRIRVSDPGYVFEWVASAEAGPVAIEVWVSDSGRAEVGVGPGIDRLEGTQQRDTQEE